MELLCLAGIMVCLAALAVIDVKHYIVPDKLNLLLAVLFLAFHSLNRFGYLAPMDIALGMFVGGGMLYGIRCAANAYYKQDALGLGDVKLMAAAGIGLGFPDIMLALSLGAFIGLIHGGVMYLRDPSPRKSFATVNVPAGLGLCAGIAVVMVMRFGPGAF